MSEKGVEFEGGSLFDGFGGSAEHLALLSMVIFSESSNSFQTHCRPLPVLTLLGPTLLAKTAKHH